MGYRYVLGRLTSVFPVLFLVSVVSFSFLHLLPGDSVLAMLGEDATSESIEERRHELGLDRPLPIQYLDWIGDVLTGNLGRSLSTGQPVAEALLDRFPVTLELTIASFLVSVVIAVPVGVLSAYKRHSWLDRLVTILALTGVAMPNFWLGILLILVFAVSLGWLPPSGFQSVTSDPVSGLRYLALPALTLGTTQAAITMRQIRSSMLEVLGEDYVRTARAKGLGEMRVVMVHALRTALIPVVTVMGVQFGRVLGGSVIVESVFAIPGMGRYAVGAIFSQDYAVVQAAVMVTAVMVILANLIVDLLYVVLDPRIRLA